MIAAPMHLAAPILVQAHALGLNNVPIIGSNAFNSDSVLHEAASAAEGLIVGSVVERRQPDARNQQFIQAYRARYGAEPDQLAAQAYSGVYILATALKDAGSSSDAHALRDALERVQRLDTPLGTFSFDAARDADYPPVVQIVRLGSFNCFGALLFRPSAADDGLGMSMLCSQCGAPAERCDRCSGALCARRLCAELHEASCVAVDSCNGRRARPPSARRWPCVVSAKAPPPRERNQEAERLLAEQLCSRDQAPPRRASRAAGWRSGYRV